MHATRRSSCRPSRRSSRTSASIPANVLGSAPRNVFGNVFGCALIVLSLLGTTKTQAAGETRSAVILGTNDASLANRTYQGSAGCLWQGRHLNPSLVLSLSLCRTSSSTTAVSTTDPAASTETEAQATLNLWQGALGVRSLILPDAWLSPFVELNLELAEYRWEQPNTNAPARWSPGVALHGGVLLHPEPPGSISILYRQAFYALQTAAGEAENLNARGLRLGLEFAW